MNGSPGRRDGGRRHTERTRAVVFSGVLAWLEPRRRSRARLAAYIRREHQCGRRLSDVLHDRVALEHASESELGLLFDDPAFIHRIADDCCSADRPHDAPLPPAA